jgi:hypothetical protein
MTNFLGTDWDRGYRAGRKEGMKEIRQDIVNLIRAASGLTYDQRAELEGLIEEETSWLD